MLDIFPPSAYLKTFAITYVAGIASAALVVLYVKLAKAAEDNDFW